MFEISMRSCFERLIAELPISNNTFDRWHRAFLQRLPPHRPTIKKFVAALYWEMKVSDYICNR